MAATAALVPAATAAAVPAAAAAAVPARVPTTLVCVYINSLDVDLDAVLQTTAEETQHYVQ